MPSTILPESTELRWFEEFPKCRCGKVAAGILRGDRNQSFGHHCKPCAARRLRNSERAQEMVREHAERARAALSKSGA